MFKFKGQFQYGGPRSLTIFWTIACLVVSSLSVPTFAVAGVPAVSAGGARQSLAVVSPVRLVDTRSGLGAPRRLVPAGGRITVQVAGRGGVPTGASGAVLNVTVTDTARSGYLQVVPHGASAGTSTVNYATGQTAANAVFTALSSTGQIDVVNRSNGAADIIVDVSGYLPAAADQAGVTVVSPVRLVDTRSGLGAPRRLVPAGGRITVQVAGRGGVPTGASGAVLNVTVTDTARSGYLQVVPHGASAGTSTVNYATGQTAANAVFTALSSTGQIDVVNRSNGAADIIVDVSGYLPAAADQAGVTVVSPVRLVDTRSGLGAPRRLVPAGGRITVQVAGRGGVPTGASGAVLNVTVTDTARSGYLQVVPHGASAGTSTVNYATGQTAANAVFTALSSTGQIDVVNRSNGAADIIVDSNAAGQSADEFPTYAGLNGNFANPGPVGITAANALKLHATWTYRSGANPGSFGDGLVFDPVAGSGFGATDMTTGMMRWTSNPPGTFVDGTIRFTGSVIECQSVFGDGVVVYGCTIDADDPNLGAPPEQVFAYDAQTGRLLWQASTTESVGYSKDTSLTPGRLAYDSGRVFVVGSAFDAFNAATGALLWSADAAAPGATFPSVVDVDAYEGRLYLTVARLSGDGYIDVWDEATPTRMWSYPVRPFDPNYYRIIVADGHVFVAADPWLVTFDAGGCGAKICLPQWQTNVRVANQTGLYTNTPRIQLGAVVAGRIFLTSNDVITRAANGGSNDYLLAIDDSNGSVSAFWSTPDAAEDPPFAAGGLIWTSSGGFAEAFPQNCGADCPGVIKTALQKPTIFVPIRISGSSLLVNGQAYQPS